MFWGRTTGAELARAQDPAAFVEKALVAARDPDLAAHFIGLPKMTRTRQVRGLGSNRL
jgi:hypothetical protein